MGMPRAHELALLDSERKKLEEERERKKLEAEAKAAASSWLEKRGGVRRPGGTTTSCTAMSQLVVPCRRRHG